VPKTTEKARSCQLYVRKQLVFKMRPTNVLIFQMMVWAYTFSAQCKTAEYAYIRQVTSEHFCVMQLVSKYILSGVSSAQWCILPCNWNEQLPCICEYPWVRKHDRVFVSRTECHEFYRWTRCLWTLPGNFSRLKAANPWNLYCSLSSTCTKCNISTGYCGTRKTESRSYTWSREII